MSKLDIPANINFALYESPLQRIIGEAVETRIKQEENAAMAHITETIGYKVDKTELIRALNYDRDQFAKGYAAGLNADKWIPVSERLPEDGIYLVTVERIAGVPRIETKSFAKDLNRVDDFSFRKHKCGWYDYDSEYGYWEDTNVIAWQPRPQPYEPQEREEV